ncbi:Glycerol kinase [Citrobacter freundii]|nr:Glycerol kinase [Citrobacter freundii]CAH6235805.1 Glycerol kinase [Citrobacter freundii]
MASFDGCPEVFHALLAVGFWQNLDELQEKAVIEREFRPGIETTERNFRYSGWKKAVKRAMAWEDHDE